MSEVYIVHAGCIYEGGDIRGVYSNREAAESHVQHLKDDEWFDSEVDYAEVRAYYPKEAYAKNDAVRGDS